MSRRKILFMHFNVFTVCRWAVFVGHHISGNNVAVRRDRSLQRCKALCESETHFRCRSFDFTWKDELACHFSVKTKEEAVAYNSYVSYGTADLYQCGMCKCL